MNTIYSTFTVMMVNINDSVKPVCKLLLADMYDQSMRTQSYS